MRFDPLRLAGWRKVEGSEESAIREVQTAGKPPGRSEACRCHARRQHREQRWRRRSAGSAGEGFFSIARKRPEARAAVGAVIEPRRRRVEQQAHFSQAEGLVRTFEENVEFWVLDMADRGSDEEDRIAPGGRWRRCGRCHP